MSRATKGHLEQPEPQDQKVEKVQVEILAPWEALEVLVLQ